MNKCSSFNPMTLNLFNVLNDVHGRHMVKTV